ncbi:MAG: hypothetical protein KJ880_04635 [Candidatus Omnitrophica bacterium]|nr:hypothetical protein [Candidatus Omnitrophota bacterium]
MFIRCRKGLSSIEYAFLIIIVVAVVLIMQMYFKRALAGRWKADMDALGAGRQY